MVRIAGFGLFALLLALFGLHAATPLQSASFDCAKASHPLEKTICASPGLSKLDGEVAALYKAKLAQIFDKASLRRQQRDWQQILRAGCVAKCDPATVAASYTQRRDTLRTFDAETWEASYKTADVATLTITHIGTNQFDFALARDREGEQLCKLPANDSEAGAIATIASAAKAHWSAGACRIDFLLSRDKTGNVTRIDTSASAGCKQYCKGNYGLSDVFLPATN
ncbi:hypothetical protein E5A73_02590 [Sphingomonas gei]|uniref:Uncharacterized protein n=1 Tax=Sphingomonas gei TaxID=1395960 RepID=A0A4S1XH94_9SPHN|nr:hypothetical protein [Sphingomonas gei]TGX56019.1 hypothetical protein E5A73_02590 [Sphingomonas gei]